ncbi:MAG: hypothetical protein AB1529_02570 [Candidatus Micrarchaeota archaeon]
MDGSELSISKSVIGLGDLPGEKVYVQLNDQTKKWLFDTALKLSGGYSRLAKAVGLPLNRRGKCKILESSRKKKIQLNVLNLLVRYLETKGIDSRKEIESSITLLAVKRGSSRKGANCLYRPKIPFDFSTESGATVISALLHDGGIDSRLHPHYCNPLDKNLRIKVSEAFRKVFGEFDFLRAEPEKNGQLYFPKIVGVVLVYGLGMMCGRKVTNNPGVPDFIFIASEKVRSAFLRQAFDDEAYVHRKYRYISLKLASASNGPSRLLLDLQKILAGLGIKSYGPRFCETYADTNGIVATKWAVEIHHHENLLKFLNLVGFESVDKQARLKEIVAALKQPHFALKEKPGILLEACRKVQGTNNFITSRELALKLNRSQALAKKEIRRLRRDGKLALVGRKRGNGAARYVMVG